MNESHKVYKESLIARTVQSKPHKVSLQERMSQRNPYKVSVIQRIFKNNSYKVSLSGFFFFFFLSKLPDSVRRNAAPNYTVACIFLTVLFVLFGSVFVNSIGPDLQSCNPVICYVKPVERTDEIGLKMISLVCSTGFTMISLIRSTGFP